MNLPNRLTISRILLVPLILLFMLPPSAGSIGFFYSIGLSGIGLLLHVWSGFVTLFGIYIAAFLFLVASLTDLLDGSIARKRGIVTNLGRFLDPIADKILVSSVLIALVRLNRVGAIAVIIILLREFVVSALRMIASDKGIVISASSLGKWKTVTQIVAILIVMLQGIYPPVFTPIADFAMMIAVLITLYSGYDYLSKHASHLVES